MAKRDDRPPAYLPIVEDIREKILDGTYPPGTALPSGPDLAETFKVTEGVARHALTRLRLEGLAYPRQGKGWYVEDPLPDEEQSLTQLVGKLQDRVEQLAARVEQLESSQGPQSARSTRRPAQSKP